MSAQNTIAPRIVAEAEPVARADVRGAGSAAVRQAPADLPAGPQERATRLARGLRQLPAADSAEALVDLLRTHWNAGALRLETEQGTCIGQRGGPVLCSHRTALGPGLVACTDTPLQASPLEGGLVAGWWVATQSTTGLQALACMVRAASHEFRNLDSVQRNAIALVKEDVQDDCLDEELAVECLEDALSASMRSHRLASRLADIGVTMTTPVSPVSVASLRPGVERALAAARIDVGLTWMVAADLPAAQAHSKELTALFVDLARNAHEAGASEVLIMADCPDQRHLLVRVRNNGATPTDQVLQHAQDAWFTTAGVRERWGLGLPHARLRVERWSGHMELRRHGTTGAEIRLVLPIA